MEVACISFAHSRLAFKIVEDISYGVLATGTRAPLIHLDQDDIQQCCNLGSLVRLYEVLTDRCRAHAVNEVHGMRPSGLAIRGIGSLTEAAFCKPTCILCASTGVGHMRQSVAT